MGIVKEFTIVWVTSISVSSLVVSIERSIVQTTKVMWSFTLGDGEGEGNSKESGGAELHHEDGVFGSVGLR
jgi:hypothetical protein